MDDQDNKRPYLAESTVEELGRLLADRMRAERIRRNFTQAAIAKSAGLALRTYRRLEATGQGSIGNLLAVLKAMDRTPVVAMFFPSAQLPESVTRGRLKKRPSLPR